jgi:ribose-phosphate pyrophosphokinase
MKWDRIKIFSGSANPALTSDVCDCLTLEPGEVSLKRFADGEIHLQILENVRGVDAFAIQPTCSPVEQNLFELLLTIDALKRASAGRITAVLPYYGYARQDRKDRPRVPISAKLVASLLERAYP